MLAALGMLLSVHHFVFTSVLQRSTAFTLNSFYRSHDPVEADCKPLWAPSFRETQTHYEHFNIISKLSEERYQKSLYPDIVLIVSQVNVRLDVHAERPSLPLLTCRPPGWKCVCEHTAGGNPLIWMKRNLTSLSVLQLLSSVIITSTSSQRHAAGL